MMEDYRDDDFEESEIEEEDGEVDFGEETAEETAEIESDARAEERLEEEVYAPQRRVHYEKLKAQYPGADFPDPDWHEGYTPEEYRKECEEPEETAKDKKKAMVERARITADAIAERLRGGPTGPDLSKLSPADWKNAEKALALAGDLRAFSQKLAESETKEDRKAIKDYQGRINYTLKAIDDLGIMDATIQETKELTDQAEKLMLQNPSNEVTWHAYHKNSDAPYVYMRRDIAEKSPWLTGKRIVGTDPLIKVDLPQGMTAKSVVEQAEHYRLGLEDFLLTKGLAPLEVTIEEGPEEPSEPSKDPEKMSYKQFKKWRQPKPREQT